MTSLIQNKVKPVKLVIPTKIKIEHDQPVKLAILNVYHSIFRVLSAFVSFVFVMKMINCTPLLCLLVRYYFCHSNIKCVSSHHCVPNILYVSIVSLVK